MVERFLVAIDDSPQSWEALEYVLDHHPDAEIVAFHVIDPVEWMAMSTPQTVGPPIEEFRTQAEEEADRILSEAKGRAAECGVEIETASETGKPHRLIIEYADEHDIDHVVMGSHGRSGVSRIVLGSVAEAVLRRSEVPVTVIR